MRVLARQWGLADQLAARAVGLVQTALASDAVREAAGGRSWREMPFMVVTPEGTMEGATDLLVEAEGGVSIVDYKTDAVTEEQREALERAYGPQIEAYESVVKRTGCEAASVRLVSPGGDKGHELGIDE